MTDNTPVVLVTGAGRGLGRAILDTFHGNGWTVVASDYDTSLLEDIRNRERTLCTALDVTDRDSCHAATTVIREQLGRLDVIVNNAGIIGYFPLIEMEPDSIIRHYEVNTFGALRVSHACLDLICAAKGRIINISSESYSFRTPFQAYQATKQALEGLSDVMRREYSHLGVHVATIRPGAMKTELFDAMNAIENPVKNSRLEIPFSRFVDNLSANAPSKIASVNDTAAVVYRAATDDKPKPHYTINNMLSLKIAGLLPSALADKLVARLLRP